MAHIKTVRMKVRELANDVDEVYVMHFETPCEEELEDKDLRKYLRNHLRFMKGRINDMLAEVE